MIFAPRSWPSRPGLAIRTRGGVALAPAGCSALTPRGNRALAPRGCRSLTSDPRRVAVNAEDLAEHVRDLAHRASDLHRGDDRRHQVRAAAGRIAYVLEPLA